MANKVQFAIKGIDELNRNLAKIAQDSPKEFGRAMFEEALIEEAESRKRTPVEWGVLKGSHETHPVEFKTPDIEVKITVGGPTASSPEGAGYSIYVHELVDNYHRVGQAKFLESTLNESRNSFGSRVARRISFNRVMGV